MKSNKAACGGSVRRIFTNTNDKTFQSSLNNLLYSHQQFLPEPTATSYASSSLHVLHQASSCIKKLIIMTLPRMIEQRRECMASRYLSLDIVSFIFFQPFQASPRRISVFREMWGGHPLPRAGQVWSTASRLSFSSSDAADMFQNMSSSSNAKVYHGMIRVFSYTFATTMSKIHNPSRTCTHVGRYLQIVIFLKVDGKSKIFMNTNMPHDSQ